MGNSLDEVKLKKENEGLGRRTQEKGTIVSFVAMPPFQSSGRQTNSFRLLNGTRVTHYVHSITCIQTRDRVTIDFEYSQARADATYGNSVSKGS